MHPSTCPASTALFPSELGIAKAVASQRVAALVHSLPERHSVNLNGSCGLPTIESLGEMIESNPRSLTPESNPETLIPKPEILNLNPKLRACWGRYLINTMCASRDF